MSIYEWVYHVLGEGIKFVLLGHWIFGYEFNQKKTRYLALLYLLGIPFVECLRIPQMVLVYEHLLGIFILLSLFQGSILEKIKGFFVMIFLISLADVFFWTLLVFFATSYIKEHDTICKIVVEGVGTLFWVVLSCRGEKIQKYIQKLWGEMKGGSYFLLLGILILLSLTLGGMQGYLYNSDDCFATGSVLCFGSFGFNYFLYHLYLVFLYSAIKEKIRRDESFKCQLSRTTTQIL